MKRSAQLGLPFDPPARYEARDFIAAESNADARIWLARPHDWPLARLALWGPEGCGKTHLLHIWAETAATVVLRGHDIDPTLQPAPSTTPIIIDDADSTPGLPLLRLLNIAGETGQPILLASRLPPARWPTIIPDLASRLRAITAVPIGPPDDTLLKLLLQRLLVGRGVAIGEDLLALLLRELPRTAAMMRAAAAALDRRALAEGRKITRDIVRHVLADLAERADLDGLAGREGDRVDSDDRGD